ncbi:MAG TPA: D-aminoacylase [Chthonomonadaceae bacterium]|nr:D-aminoacylase [Chthonomonadaceae bacterium]
METIISGAQVLDGTGRPGFRADVGIQDGKIAAIGDLREARAAACIDADGLTLAPGFIDLHSHCDALLAQPFDRQQELMRGRVCQGITTELIGNCGFAAAPVTPATRPLVEGMLGFLSAAEPLSWNWRTTADYLAHLERSGLVLNVAALVAHGPIRVLAMGGVEGRQATAEEIARMRRAVRESLEQGAFGISFGLVYPPGQYAPTEEVAALCEVVAAFGNGVGRRRFANFHQRGGTLESLLPSLEEIVGVGRATGASVHLSHDQVVASHDWVRHAEADIALSERACAEGIDYTQEVFPYTSVGTTLLALYPPWALEGGLRAFLERLSDPVLRARMRHDIEHVLPEWPPWLPGRWPINIVRAVGWENIRIAFVAKPRNKPFEGRSVPEIAARMGKSPFDAVSDLLLDEEADIQQIVIGITGNLNNEEGMRLFLAHPTRAFCTDAWDTGRGKPHPGVFGAYPRILGKYTREERLLSLPEAIRKMTSLPAARLGLTDRGSIAEGYHADLVLFDPTTIADRATFEHPRQTPLGLPYVFVNGRAVVWQGEYRPQPAGQVLRA